MADRASDLESAESIRLLAGSIAHDFNNMLGVLVLHLAIAKMQVEPDQEVFQSLTEAEHVALRAQGVTQQLLAVSGPEVTIRRTTAIGDLVKEAVDSVVLRSNVKCSLFIPDDLLSVDCDAGQISYAFTTLVRHAAAVLPHGGALVVAAENTDGAGRPELPAGRYVRLTIEADRPSGRTADEAARAARAGLDFGLGRAYAVIEQHEGVVTWTTVDGVGSRLLVYLPASPHEVGTPTRAEVESPRSLKILFMDDEGLIRAVAGDVLRRLGHAAEIAKDGAEAVALYRRAWEAGAAFDVVILDLTVLGGVGARGAIHELQKIDPGVRAIVSTGYSNDPIVENYREHGFRASLIKPYRVAELREALQRATSAHA